MINLPGHATVRVDSTKCFVPHQLDDMSNNMFGNFNPLKCVKKSRERCYLPSTFGDGQYPKQLIFVLTVGWIFTNKDL